VPGVRAGPVDRLCGTRQADRSEDPMLVDMMKLTTLTCSLALAAAAILNAQSSETAPKTQGQPNDGKPVPPAISAPSSIVPATTTPPPRSSPQQRLEDAKAALASVSEKSLPLRAQKAFAQLLKDFSALASSYKAEPEGDAWPLIFSDVERDLSPLIGVGSSATPIKDPNMPDAATRVILGAFRTHVELFYDAASIASASGRTTAP